MNQNLLLFQLLNKYVLYIFSGDKTLTRDEFTEFWTMHTGLSKDISEALYDIYDTDKNGLISDMESANLFKGFDFNRKYLK